MKLSMLIRGAILLALVCVIACGVECAPGDFVELPPLPYKYDALQPFLSEEQLKLHHLGHHQAYTNKLNAIVKELVDVHGVPLPPSVDELISPTYVHKLPTQEHSQALLNNGGGWWNHSFFWTILSPRNESGNLNPDSALYRDIVRDFGSLETFKSTFSTAAETVMGSGWAWAHIHNNAIVVTQSLNQDSPLTAEGHFPFLTLDVWEHAYYLDYKNKRPAYVRAFWDHVDWATVQRLYDEALAALQ